MLQLYITDARITTSVSSVSLEVGFVDDLSEAIDSQDAVARPEPRLYAIIPTEIYTYC